MLEMLSSKKLYKGKTTKLGKVKQTFINTGKTG